MAIPLDDYLVLFLFIPGRYFQTNEGTFWIIIIIQSTYVQQKSPSNEGAIWLELKVTLLFSIGYSLSTQNPPYRLRFVLQNETTIGKWPEMSPFWWLEHVVLCAKKR